MLGARFFLFRREHSRRHPLDSLGKFFIRVVELRLGLARGFVVGGTPFLFPVLLRSRSFRSFQKVGVTILGTGRSARPISARRRRTRARVCRPILYDGPAKGSNGFSSRVSSRTGSFSLALFQWDPENICVCLVFVGCFFTLTSREISKSTSLASEALVLRRRRQRGLAARACVFAPLPWLPFSSYGHAQPLKPLVSFATADAHSLSFALHLPR